MDKRFLLLTVLCPLWTFSFGQKPDEIHFKGDVITITGERLKSVNGENNVWEIDLKQKEDFKLISDNRQIVHYHFSKMCVKGHTGSQWKSFYDIPLSTKKDTVKKKTVELPDFWSSTALTLIPDSLPLDIQSNGKVIATFRLKKRVIYQKVTKLNKKEYNEGDTIKLSKSTGATVDIVCEKIKLVLDNDHSHELKDNVIDDLIKDGESAKYDVIVSVNYSDKTSNDFNLGSIVIHKQKGAISNWLNFINENWKTLLVYICLSLLLVFLILYRKLIFKYSEKICSKVGLYNVKTDDKEELSNKGQQTDIDNFQIRLDDSMSEDKPNQQDVGYETCIQTLNRRIRELENKLKDLSGSALDIKTLRERIGELENSEKAKLDEIDELSNENTTLKEEKISLQNRLDNISIDSTSKKDLRNKIEELKGDKNKLIREKESKERELTEARKTITSLETKVKEKDDKITETMKQKDEAESNLRIEKNTTVALQNKINSFSRQTYYLYAIDDTLQAVDNSLKSLFINVYDDNLMKRLAQPVLSGTAGLDAGLESYLSEWKDTVYNHQNLFFGTDVLSMSDESVKEKLTEFLEQLALRDSFGKLVRLYLMTNVGWINDKMVAAGFDVDAIQTLFVRFKNLFQLFNIDILYPHLFVDKFDSNLHKDNMRCEIFNYFEPSEELLKQLKNRDNENLIVDVTRIGIPNSKNPTRRNAMVSLPNF